MRNPVGNVPWRARGAASAMGTTVAAWPSLPGAIKAGIVAMVKAASEKEDVIRNKGYNSRMMTYATLQSDRREFLVSPSQNLIEIQVPATL